MLSLGCHPSWPGALIQLAVEQLASLTTAQDGLDAVPDALYAHSGTRSFKSEHQCEATALSLAMPWVTNSRHLLAVLPTGGELNVLQCVLL